MHLRNILLFISVLFAFFCFFDGKAQRYNVRTYQSSDGLVSSNINSIFEDSKGYIWIATTGGISKFDGKKFVNYNTKSGLPGNQITSICEDQKGSIWFGTDGFGLFKFDGINWTVFDKNNGLHNNKIYSIYCDREGNLWIPSLGAGVMKYDGKQFISYSEKTGFPIKSVYCILQDNKGIIWVGTRREGLYKFKNDVFTKVEGLKSEGVFSLLEDSKKNIWIGTYNAGVCKIDSTGNIQDIKIPELNNDFIADIIEDKRGNIWLATGHGLLKINDNGHLFFSDKNGLTSNNISAICENYEGNLWIGSFVEGLTCLFSESFVVFTEKDGLLGNKITSIAKSDSNEYYVASIRGGINKFSNQKLSSYIEIPPGDNILKLFFDKKETLWCGFESGKIEKINLKTKQRVQLENTFYNKSPITDIRIDKHGLIWVSSYGDGVFTIDDKGRSIYLLDSTKIPNKNILSLYIDKKDALWISAFQGGVIKYDGKKYINYTVKNGLLDNTITAIYQDENENMYFGTENQGISIFDGVAFKKISLEDGLCSDMISSLYVDKSNNLWIGTDKGVNKVEFTTEKKIKKIKYFGTKDGLLGTEVLSNGFLPDNNGNIWIPTSNGLARYNPTFDFANTTPPKLLLTGMKLFYKDVNWKDYADSINPLNQLPMQLVLSPKDNHLTFSFQALTTDKVKYTYKLEGLDDSWSPLSNANEAIYSNIPTGRSYTFKVKAINSDGYWSEKVIEYSFTIRPTIWQTWWFYVILGIVLLASIIGYIQWRTSRLEKEKQLLEEKVSERTKELSFAHNKLSYAYRDIKDSIQYAKQIQDAILPAEQELKKVLPNSFILYKPRDVVSGDFYWFKTREEKIYFAAVDCTGHGVPGAFMSMIGSTLLNEIIAKKMVIDPSSVLSHLNKGIRKSLQQDQEKTENKDGMDIALCSYNPNNMQLEFSGAKRPLYVLKNNKELLEIKGDKLSIGGFSTTEQISFFNHQLQLQKGDRIYLFSDGLVDQFGGENGKKLTTKKLKEILLSLHALTMHEQRKKINEIFENWRSEVEQIDDVLMIGVEV